MVFTETPRSTSEDEWTIHTSSDGRTYYYNRRTENSQWDKPRGWSQQTKPAGDTNNAKTPTEKQTKADWSKLCRLCQEYEPEIEQRITDELVEVYKVEYRDLTTQLEYLKLDNERLEKENKVLKGKKEKNPKEKLKSDLLEK